MRWYHNGFSKRQFYRVMSEAVLPSIVWLWTRWRPAGNEFPHVTSERSSRLISLNVPRFAPGGPGIEPRWTRGTKVAVGDAYCTSNRVWDTPAYRCVSRGYYPNNDSAPDLCPQLLVTTAEKFFSPDASNVVW